MADIRIGVFGAWRGNSYIKLMMEEERIDLIAICDKNIHTQEKDHDFKDIALFDRLRIMHQYFCDLTTHH